MGIYTFIDTSVLVEILDVPGKAQCAQEIQAEFEERGRGGEKFVIPITALIETGNHVCQVKSGHEGCAKRYVQVIEAASWSEPPWIIRDVQWDAGFMKALLNGVSSGTPLETHLLNKTMGTGDLAILVEREQFRRAVKGDVRIWSLDSQLAAHA